MLNKLVKLWLLIALCVLAFCTCTVNQCSTEPNEPFVSRFVVAVDHLGEMVATVATVQVRREHIRYSCVCEYYGLIVVFFIDGHRAAFTYNGNTLMMLQTKKPLPSCI